MDCLWFLGWGMVLLVTGSDTLLQRCSFEAKNAGIRHKQNIDLHIDLQQAKLFLSQQLLLTKLRELFGQQLPRGDDS
jgi:hypothetical protein